MKFSFDHKGETFQVDLTPAGTSYRATVGETSVEVEILEAEDGNLELRIDGTTHRARISFDQAMRWVTIDGRTFLLARSSGARRRGHGHSAAAGELTAPMPGQVRAVNVESGQAVTRGQTLLVLEAMKMEIRIQAPGDGVVGRVLVRQGQTVEREQVLVQIDEREPGIPGNAA